MMGRDQSACEFVFDSSANGISRTHCKVQFNPQTGMFVLYDLGSSYGTFLANGTRVPQGQPMALGPGEQFYLADRGCMFMVNL
jgi:pSer/pThr/pTyr-binding forkhead associated (FHA) protein